MAGRVWRWVGGGLALGLLPLVASFLFAWYRLEHPPALRDVLGGGQTLLVGVMWCAAALRESRDSPFKSHRDGVQLAATFFLLVGAMAYGLVMGDTTAGRGQTENQQGMVTVASLALLLLAATISSYAVAIARK